jgi:hypothetical protein
MPVLCLAAGSPSKSFFEAVSYQSGLRDNQPEKQVGKQTGDTARDQGNKEDQPDPNCADSEEFR